MYKALLMAILLFKGPDVFIALGIQDNDPQYQALTRLSFSALPSLVVAVSAGKFTHSRKDSTEPSDQCGKSSSFLRARSCRRRCLVSHKACAGLTVWTVRNAQITAAAQQRNLHRLILSRWC